MRYPRENKHWICETCNHSLKRGNLPVQAKVNGLKLDNIPAELSELNVGNKSHILAYSIHGNGGLT